MPIIYHAQTLVNDINTVKTKIKEDFTKQGKFILLGVRKTTTTTRPKKVTTTIHFCCTLLRSLPRYFRSTRHQLSKNGILGNLSVFLTLCSHNLSAWEIIMPKHRRLHFEPMRKIEAIRALITSSLY